MDDPALLQTGPDTFTLLLGGGERRELLLSSSARRELGLHGVPPLSIATEIVRLLQERGTLPSPGSDLIAEVARQPGGLEELRSRFG